MADFTAGQELTAAALIAALPIVKFKASDRSVASSTTAQNDDDLFAPVQANRSYVFAAVLNFTGDAAADAKFGFTFPTGARLDYHFLCIDTGGTLGSFASINGSSGATNAVGVAGVSTFRPTHVRGTLQVGATAGTFRLVWAQNSSNATATVLCEGSHLVLTRVPV